ncbi:hypothetical protein Tco_0360371 [Tanacetum coccineum]
MKESKAYKTYLGFAIGAVPPKAARKFKKASPSKKDNVPIPEDEEPVKKGKRLKTTAKKSAYKPATGIVIREPTVETKSKRKKKEKVDVAHGKGIELLSDGNDKDDSNEEHISSDEGSEEENESDKQASDSEQEEESEDDDQEENKDDDDLELESNDKIEGDEERDDTTDQFNDDADARLEEPTETATGIVQGEGTDAEMTESQQGNENLETTQEQVVEDAHVMISTVTKKTKVPVTSSSRSSDLASKFLNFLDIPYTNAEIVSPLDVPVHHEVPRTQAPTLLLIPVSVIHESSPTKRLGEKREEFINFLSESFTARIKEQVKDQLPQILPQEVSNFAPPVIEKLFHETRDEVTLAKASSQLQSTYEDASRLTEFELKKILLDKIEKSESYLMAPKHRECYDGLKKSYALDKYFFYSYDVYTLKRGQKDTDKDEDPSAGSDRGLKRRKTSKDAEPTVNPKKKDSTSGSSKGIKSHPRSSGKSVQSEEPVFEVADSDMPQDQEGDMGDNEYEPRKETASKSDWFKKPTPVQEPTDPDWHVGKTTLEGPPQK